MNAVKLQFGILKIGTATFWSRVGLLLLVLLVGVVSAYCIIGSFRSTQGKPSNEPAYSDFAKFLWENGDLKSKKDFQQWWRDAYNEAVEDVGLAKQDDTSDLLQIELSEYQSAELCMVPSTESDHFRRMLEIDARINVLHARLPPGDIAALAERYKRNQVGLGRVNKNEPFLTAIYFLPGTANHEQIRFLVHYPFRSVLTELDLLNQAGVTDGEVKYICRLKKLRKLNIYGTSISNEGLATLRASLPDCTIYYSFP